MKPCSSKKVRDSANGESCTMMSNMCNDDGYNVHLCHIPLKGMAGMGQKAHDFLAFYGCEGCHRYFDTEGRGDPQRWELAFLAQAKTQTILYELGLLKIVGDKNER